MFLINHRGHRGKRRVTQSFHLVGIASIGAQNKKTLCNSIQTLRNAACPDTSGWLNHYKELQILCFEQI